MSCEQHQHSCGSQGGGSNSSLCFLFLLLLFALVVGVGIIAVLYVVRTSNDVEDRKHIESSLDRFEEVITKQHIKQVEKIVEVTELESKKVRDDLDAQEQILKAQEKVLLEKLGWVDEKIEKSKKEVLTVVYAEGAKTRKQVDASLKVQGSKISSMDAHLEALTKKVARLECCAQKDEDECGGCE